MTFKKLAVATAVALASFTATHANAQAQTQAPGLYAGIGYSQLTLEDSGLSIKPTQILFKLGYNFDKTWAVEGRLGTSGASDSARIGAASVDVKIDSFSAIYGKGTIPLGEQFEAYGLLGYNSATAKASAGGFSANSSKDGGSYGVGAQFNATKNIGLNVEWVRHFSDTTSIGFGVNYKF